MRVKLLSSNKLETLEALINDFIEKNENDYLIKQIKVECTKNGTMLKYFTTIIYEKYESTYYNDLYNEYVTEKDDNDTLLNNSDFIEVRSKV